MTLSEFETRFDELWRERYTNYNPETDHWTRKREDEDAKLRCHELLITYAREIQSVGSSRSSKNRAAKLFEEMGIDPKEVDLDGRHSGNEQSAEGSRTQTRIMYVERKAGQLTGEARIGRVTYSRTFATIYYGGKSFRSLYGAGFKSNYYCVETGENYWISGCRRDGCDRLYGERTPIHIDEDVRKEYWTTIRRQPSRINDSAA